MAVMTDFNLKHMVPNATLFPDVPNDVLLHSGFAYEHQKTAPEILAEVKRLMAQHSSTHVVLVGHCRYASELRADFNHNIDRSFPGRSARGARYIVHEAQSPCGDDGSGRHVWHSACREWSLGYLLRLTDLRLYKDEQ
jgi:hypothetical protein